MRQDRARAHPHISPMGLSSVLFEAPGAFDLDNQRRIWTLADTVARWPGVIEAAPGMTNLLVSFAAPLRDPAAVEQALCQAWEDAEPAAREGRLFEIPVVYGGEGGPDLDHMARDTGLDREDVVTIHAGREYTVFALGSHPGYGYLGVVDPRLFIPRRQVPRVSVPAGSVSIGGWQTGASASAGPSGWHTIGQTDTVFFDPAAAEPVLLQPGDRIRFIVSALLP